MLRSSVAGPALRTPHTTSSERPLVLVVDPDRSARAVLEVALSRDGFDVWSAESADQGLAVLGRGRTPDVIVLESDLGQSDGFAFCAELRGDARTAKVPVVLLAQANDANVANLAEVVGVDEAVQKPAFARDVVALVRLELVRHRSTTGAALRFNARTLAPAHLLRALLTSTRSGAITLAEGRATLRFTAGEVIDARFGERWGIDALVRALALTSQEYTVRLEPVVRTGGFACSLKDLVAQVLPRLAKWGQVSARSLPLDAVLAVDFLRLAQALPSMPDDVNRIVQLFDGRRRVQDVLLDSTFDELLTLEVATRLYLMGVVGPVAGAASEEELKAAPRLFEPRSAEAEDLMRQLFDGLTEIRAADVEPAPTDDADWVAPALAGAELQVDDPAGGWQAAALPESHVFDEMEEEVARTLAAFNPPTVVEPREARVEERPVAAFADGKVEADDSLEVAFRSATGDREAQAVMADDPTPPSAQRRFTEDDRQERIITPVLNPVVRVEAPVAAPIVASATVMPVEALPVRIVKDTAPSTSLAAPALEAEAAFFATDDAVAFEDTISSNTAEKPRRVGALLVGLGVAAVLAAIGVEWLTSNAPKLPEVPVVAVLNVPPAPVAAPVEVLPAPAALEPVAVVEPELVLAEPEVLDVSEALADGVQAYQRGEYRKAVSVLEQVVTDDPRSVQGWLVLGQARYDASDAKGAREAAQKVLELDPKHAGVHVLLATVAHDAGDKATMRQELETYLSLEPAGPHAAEAKALLGR